MRDNAVKNIQHIVEEIQHSAREYHLRESDMPLPPKIIAVSKTHHAEKIEPLLKAGYRIFGENRVQEAKAKWPALKEAYPETELHLIGPLQTNKVKEALGLFDVIQTLDREKLAHALASQMADDGCQMMDEGKRKSTKEREASKPEQGKFKKPSLFIQVNTGEEPQKAGIAPKEAGGFIDFCVKELALPVAGLMCIPPLEENPAPHFALLKKLAEEHNLPHLSMGMSGDYALAAAMGATHVRIGTAIFGERGKGG